MSNYYRFYIKTRSPRRVEQLIIETLGGDAWLETYGDGYLRPLAVALRPGEERIVFPKFDSSGWPITSDSETGWFWLEAQLKFGSDEASSVATALLAQTRFKYPLIEMLAVDTEADSEDGGGARIVKAEHYLIRGQAEQAN